MCSGRAWGFVRFTIYDCFQRFKRLNSFFPLSRTDAAGSRHRERYEHTESLRKLSEPQQTELNKGRVEIYEHAGMRKATSSTRRPPSTTSPSLEPAKHGRGSRYEPAEARGEHVARKESTRKSPEAEQKDGSGGSRLSEERNVLRRDMGSDAIRNNRTTGEFLKNGKSAATPLVAAVTPALLVLAVFCLCH